MGPLPFMRSVVDRNVVMRRIPVMAHMFLYQKLHFYWNFNISWGHSLRSSDYFSTKSLSSSSYFFIFLRETLNAGRVKPSAEASELFTHAAFQLVVVRKTTPSDSILQQAKKTEVGGAKSGWGRTNSRCRCLRVNSWLASSGPLKVSC